MTLPNARNGALGGTGPTRWRGATADYAVVIHNDWSATVHKRVHGETAWSAGVDLSTVPDNPLALPIDSEDTHYRLAICELPDGNVFVAGNSHNDERRCVVTETPGDLSTFVDGSSLLDASGTGVDSFVYDIFTKLADGTVLWLLAQNDSLTFPVVLGRDVGLWKWGPGDSAWSPHTGTGEIAVCNEVDEDGDPERVYNYGICVDGNDFGVFIIWQFEAFDDTTRRELCYIEHRGGQWQTVDGTPVTLPLTKAMADSLSACNTPDELDATRAHGAPAFDRDGRPHITVTGPLGGGNGRRHYWWTGTEWDSENVSIQVSNLIRLADGTLWRYLESSDTLVAISMDTGTTVVLAGAVPDQFAPMPDPVLAAEGVLGILVPDGDDPYTITFGRRAALRG